MIKPEDDVDNEAFKGYDLNLKSEWVNVVNQYDEMFRKQSNYLQRGESKMKYNCRKSVFFITLACIGSQ